MKEAIKSASSEIKKAKTFSGKIEGINEQVEQKKEKLISKFSLIIISGPSGVGKSEVVKRLLNYPELNNQQLIYATTRSPRNGEIDSQDYYFVSRKEFLKRVANNQFLNYVEYNNNYYGVPLNSLKKDLLTKNILHIVNVEGFWKMKEVWEGKIISFWLQPPHWDKLISNLQKRGDKEEEIKKRLIIDEKETPFAKEYDFILTVNDNLDQVVEEIKKEMLFSIEQEQHKNQQQLKILPSPPPKSL